MTLPEMIPHLQPGDCITHCFKGGSTTVLNEDNQVYPELIAAKEKGIIFDIGHGFGSFNWIGFISSKCAIRFNRHSSCSRHGPSGHTSLF